jgi:hypothetical protein
LRCNYFPLICCSLILILLFITLRGTLWLLRLINCNCTIICYYCWLCRLCNKCACNRSVSYYKFICAWLCCVSAVCSKLQIEVLPVCCCVCLSYPYILERSAKISQTEASEQCCVRVRQRRQRNANDVVRVCPCRRLYVKRAQVASKEQVRGLLDSSAVACRHDNSLGGAHFLIGRT